MPHPRLSSGTVGWETLTSSHPTLDILCESPEICLPLVACVTGFAMKGLVLLRTESFQSPFSHAFIHAKDYYQQSIIAYTVWNTSLSLQNRFTLCSDNFWRTSLFRAFHFDVTLGLLTCINM